MPFHDQLESYLMGSIPPIYVKSIIIESIGDFCLLFIINSYNVHQ